MEIPPSERCLVCFTELDINPDISLDTSLCKNIPITGILENCTNTIIKRPFSTKMCQTCSNRLDSAMKLSIDFRVTQELLMNKNRKSNRKDLEVKMALKLWSEYKDKRKIMPYHEVINVDANDAEPLSELDVKPEIPHLLNDTDNIVIEIDDDSKSEEFDNIFDNSSDKSPEQNIVIAEVHTMQRPSTSKSGNNVESNSRQRTNEGEQIENEISDCKSENSGVIFYHDSLRNSLHQKGRNLQDNAPHVNRSTDQDDRDFNDNFYNILTQIKHEDTNNMPPIQVNPAEAEELDVNIQMTPLIIQNEDIDVNVCMTPVDLIPEINTSTHDECISKHLKPGVSKPTFNHKAEVTVTATNSGRVTRGRKENVGNLNEMNVERGDVNKPKANRKVKRTYVNKARLENEENLQPVNKLKRKGRKPHTNPQEDVASPDRRLQVTKQNIQPPSNHPVQGEGTEKPVEVNWANEVESESQFFRNLIGNIKPEPVSPIPQDSGFNFLSAILKTECPQDDDQAEDLVPTETNKHVCLVCNIHFKRSSSLTSHNKTVHNMDGSGLYDWS